MSSKKNIEITQDNFIKIAEQILEQSNSDRSRWLERYDRQDADINSPDEFIVQGKVLAEYLRGASDCTNKLVNLAKLYSDIILKSEGISSGQSSGLSDDDLKEAIQQQMMDKESLDANLELSSSEDENNTINTTNYPESNPKTSSSDFMGASGNDTDDDDE